MREKKGNSGAFVETPAIRTSLMLKLPVKEERSERRLRKFSLEAAKEALKVKDEERTKEAPPPLNKAETVAAPGEMKKSGQIRELHQGVKDHHRCF